MSMNTALSYIDVVLDVNVIYYCLIVIYNVMSAFFLADIYSLIAIIMFLVVCVTSLTHLVCHH